MSSADTKTFSQKNAEHFNKVPPGQQWPQWVLDLHRQISSFLGSDECSTWLGLPAAGSPGRMLDYACGDGVIGHVLHQHFEQIIGVDVAAGMVDKFRARAAAAGLDADGRMVAVCADLISEDGATVPGYEMQDFDLVVSSMALHHFADPEVALRRLAARAKPGGAVLIVDWAPWNVETPAQKKYEAELREKGVDPGEVRKAFENHAASHTISKPTFSEKEMGELFAAAGCGEYRWKLNDELSPIPVIPNGAGQLFWARATKM